MEINDTIIRMIEYSKGNTHDISHFLKVHSFARLIGQKECLATELQLYVELAAIVHDIACPLCREKYGNTNGKYQEIEGEKLAYDFLDGLGYNSAVCDRVSFLVGHHHTFTKVDNVDYQILLEADFLVNFDEGKMTGDQILSIRKNVFKTSTGLALLDSIYLNRV
ncbi:MAG: phosphohydrolase [Erysipelotrichaceae bacterium]|nr:phosphohydrolase [Erysipelotrichaceae bacterium]MDD3810449.1 phosphohydrolase [Erysipelotrichaceae bacterium]